ncbi:MAG: HEAT repeat domain-containing protein [Candidatus Obscuribacter sp.]|nr:HEAT repeat domain-containing protein [Candidatus Obscuribacter sp.]
MHSSHHQDYLKASSDQLEHKEIHKLAKHQSARVKARIAEREDTPLELLIALAQDPDPEVRLGLTARKAIPLSVLAILIFDDSPDVRYELADNPDLHHTQLHHLTEDSNPYVAERAWQTLKKKKVTPITIRANQSQKHQVKVFTGGTINALTILDTVAELLPDCFSFEIREYDIRDLDYLTQATRYGISAVPAIVVDEELAYMGSHIKDSYKQTNSKEICRREKHPQKKQSSNKCALHGISCQQIA